MTVERGPLFLVAGGAMPATAHGPDPLVRLAIQSTGVHLPRIAYVGVASRDDSLIRKRHAAMLRKAGAGVITTAPLAGYRINAPVAAAAVESADLVFLSGGDVEAGMDVLEERGIIPVLRRAHRAGVPFLGISAGSIMLSRAWVRWRDPDDDGGGETFPCLGFARIFCDTHGEDDGWGELKAMLSLRPVGTKGFGIVSGSALMVAPDGTLGALGGGVHVFKRLKAGVVQVESLVPGPGPGPCEMDSETKEEMSWNTEGWAARD